MLGKVDPDIFKERYVSHHPLTKELAIVTFLYTDEERYSIHT